MPVEEAAQRKEQVYLNDKFWNMHRSAIAQKVCANDFSSHAIISLDPGETTGVCYKAPDSSELNLEQWETKEIGSSFDRLMHMVGTAQHAYGDKLRLVAEDYKVYGWKADDHKWAGLHTPQWIGAIKVCAHILGVPIHFQMAVEAKRFVTDDKLKGWNAYERGLKHARDAERHLLHYLTFGGSSTLQ